MEAGRPQPRFRAKRVALIALYMLAAAWTFRGVLAGHRVQNYTFEEALALIQAGTDNPRACMELRDRICKAVAVLRHSGPNGTVAVQAIHEETR